MRPSLILLILTCLIFSCTEKTSTRLLNDSNLPSQIFTVDINRDTVLQTAKGCVIQIPKGSLQSDSANLKLEIKEALSNTDIVLAGLNTMSGKQALSSGGMLYFNAASGYKVEIKKQLSVSVPTQTYNRDMKVFKGDSVNGKIDWKDPQPLPEDETTKKIDYGKDMFRSNCSNCHMVTEDRTGPALYGITEKRNKDWIYAYTRHDFSGQWDVEGESTSEYSYQDSSDHLYWHPTKKYDNNEIHYYHMCQKRKYGSEMTAFRSLSNKDIDAIYTYIKYESDKRPDLKEKFKSNCCDSCITYIKAKENYEKIAAEKDRLIEDNGMFFSLEREIPIAPASSVSVDVQQTEIPDTKVKHVYNSAVYYTINIATVGWYNIDILMKDYNQCVSSELMVRLQGNYKVDFNVTLIIPSAKVFVEGGKLNDDTNYGFDEADGKIPLPQGADCIVLAFAESDGKIIYGKSSFNAKTKQTIDVSLIEITKDALKTEIMNLGLDNVSAEVNDSKNADKVREADKKLKTMDLEKLKPKNCDCDFLPAADTSAKK